MSFNSTTWPVRSTNNSIITSASRWNGGGAAADCTRIAGRGVASVAYNAATGAYIITFTDVGATWLGCHLQILNVAGTTAAQKVVNSVAYSASAKTLTIFVTDVATPTAIAIAATDELQIFAIWAESDAP